MQSLRLITAYFWDAISQKYCFRKKHSDHISSNESHLQSFEVNYKIILLGIVFPKHLDVYLHLPSVVDNCTSVETSMAWPYQQDGGFACVGWWKVKTVMKAIEELGSTQLQSERGLGLQRVLEKLRTGRETEAAT